MVAAATRSPRLPRWSERDAWLICYPDQFGSSGLRGVREVARELAPEINGVHVLPFHPSSSDGGFSVQDYAMVDPAVGSWDDVSALATDTRLMADAVINHVSAEGVWFRAHLAGDPDVADFFRVVAPGTDLTSVTRPRPGPPVTVFSRADGTAADYWTTFSADQVDLDYRSPDVLLAVFAAVFRLVVAGASAVRLDAVAYIGKDPATSSIHLPGAHTVVALLRSCLDEIDPGVVLITETNVPHADNVGYLGSEARPEAHAIYQFTLAPLILHALHTGDAGPLMRWAAGIEARPRTSALNFLASHDGVGVRPAKGWLSAEQIADLAARCVEAGGVVNEAATVAGNEPYELAATWRSLCEVGEGGPFSTEQIADRMVASHSLAFALAGVPLVYVHSLVASVNDRTRFEGSGVPRDLNRGRFDSPAAFRERRETDPVGGIVWPRLREMLAWRGASPAFHPEAGQRLIDSPDGVVGVHRSAGDDAALVLVNLSGETQSVSAGDGWCDRSDGRAVRAVVELAPWTTRWLVSAP
ncbi:MAG: alpha-amylase family glycosyl hydrolase [Acidimicrobiales bacterium]